MSTFSGRFRRRLQTKGGIQSKVGNKKLVKKVRTKQLNHYKFLSTNMQKAKHWAIFFYTEQEANEEQYSLIFVMFSAYKGKAGDIQGHNRTFSLPKMRI